MAGVTICSDFGAPPNKVCLYFHCFPIYLPWSDGTGCMILVFWMLSFKSTFSLLFHFHQEALWFFFTFFHNGGVIWIMRLLIFLLEVLIPACALSSLAFPMMYCACKLNKQGDNLQPWRTPFPIWNQSVVPCPVLTVDLHTDFSRGRSGGLVFPSLEEFPTVCCDPHSQRLWSSL